MAKKPTYEELEQRVKDLEKESLDRKQAEQVLESERDKLKTLLDGLAITNIGVDIVSTDFEVLQQNQTLIDRFGDIVGKKCYKEYMALEEPCSFCPMVKALEDKGSERAELRGADGRDYEILAAPLTNPDGTVDKAIEVVQDITDRKQAEEALRESEELFSKAFHSNPNPLLISTLIDGRCIDVNEGFLRALGYNREEVIGRTSSELMLWVDTNDRLKVMQALEQGKRASLPEVKVRTKSGEIRIMMFAADKIELGGEECLITSANDITESVKAKEDLHKYERIVAASNDHMSLIDRNYVYQVVNDAYLRNHNVKLEDIIGHSVPELFGQEFFETHQKPMIDRCLAGEVARYQSWIDFPTVGRRYMDIAHYPYFEDDGSISGYVVNAHDITERKQAEEASSESEEKYRMLFNSINDSVFVYQLRADSKPNKFIEVNDVACRMYGYTREELFELTPLDLAIPERKEDAQMRMRSLIADKYSIFEIAHKTKNGNEIPVEISAHLFDFYGQPTVLSVVRDITDRKQAEEALRESEVKYRLLAENVTDVIWVRDMNLHLTYISPSVKDQQGYTVEEAMSRTLEEVLTPGSFKLIGEVYTEELEIERGGSQEGTQRSRTIEVEINCKDSSTIWAEIKMSFLRDNNGKPIGVIGVTRNITERKQTEEALRESEEKYRNIIFESPVGISIYDESGQCVDVNDSITRIVGTTKERALQQNYNHIESWKKSGLLDKAKSAVEEQSTKRHYLKENTTFEKAVSLDCYLVPFSSGGLLLMVSDISEQKRAEEALRESESKFRNLFDLSPQAVALTEVKSGRLVDINNKLCELTKYPKEEILGLTTTEVGFYPEADRSKFLKELQASGEVNGLEMEFKAKDNSILYAHMFARIIQIEGESFILTIFHDVTEQKRLESQLQQAQKMESIGTLAGGIAHDFNNILSPILLYTEMMLEDVPAENTLKFNLKEVYNAVIRARALIRQILTFSRQTEPEKASIIINPIIKEALKLLRSSLPTTIEIRQNIKSDVSVVLADPTQIHQVLMNLCTNAAYAMREKGGLLEVSLVDVDLTSQDTDHIPDLEPGQYVKLVVSDTGTGMESSVKERILEPYFTTKNKGEGTGLGLAVVHGIVKSYDGAIAVDSEPGKGTVFQLFLPLIKGKISSRSTSATQLPRGNERVLLVDDEMSILKVQQQMLERLGYRVDISEGGLAALEVFRGDPDGFDLIVTDYTMPEMTGTDLAKAVMNIRDDIPVILNTGFSEQINEEKAKALGIRAFVMKPIVMNEMAEIIRQVLDGDKYALKERL